MDAEETRGRDDVEGRKQRGRVMSSNAATLHRGRDCMRPTVDIM